MKYTVMIEIEAENLEEAAYVISGGISTSIGEYNAEEQHQKGLRYLSIEPDEGVGFSMGTIGGEVDATFLSLLDQPVR